ncbi:hypothetical protein BDZ45DRAFT_811764 [Acephala macrosclerotiorum]|nr:hypothetical protein BDZ45DRAFT_811764 [Acephala macrosclerotiorum]
METFEHFGIPAESIPGMGQISKVKATLTPYFGRMDFKDRLLLSHRLFSGLSNSDEDPTVLWLVQTNTFYVYLVSKGPQGLQLMPHTFSVLDAKVVFFINSTKNEDALWKEHAIEELASKDILDQGASNWLVSCDRAKFLQFHCPNVKGRILKSISHYVTVKFFGIIQHMLEVIPAASDIGLEFDRFMRAFTPQIQDRAMEAIQTLDFLPEAGDFYRACFATAENETSLQINTQEMSKRKVVAKE